MSNCAHRQSTYKLRKLPDCKRCKVEMILVSVMYDKSKHLSYEWECPHCGKTIPKNIGNEETLRSEDEWLSNWCKDENRNRRLTPANN